MNIGIIVEGRDDVETYPVLMRKIRSDIERVFPVDCRGLRNLKNKFVGFLKDFAKRRDREITKVIVIRDSDCGDSHELELRLREDLRRSRLVPPFPVHFHATKCKLESWLLADEEAINALAHSRGKVERIERIAGDLEATKDADNQLAMALWQVGLPASEQVYADIARFSNLRTVTERCPHFRRFEEHVRAC